MGQVIALRAASVKNPRATRASRIFEAEQRREEAVKYAQSLMLGAFLATAATMIALSFLPNLH